MKIINHFFLLIFSGLSIFCFSCRKFLEIPAPKNQLVNSTVFTDSAGATSAVTGIYINMMRTFSLNTGSGGLTLYPGLSADELYPTHNLTDENDFYQNEIAANNGLNNSALWGNAYPILYQANACLEGLTQSHIPVQVKNQLMGEVQFIRGFILFNLTNLYGAIPLVLTTDYHQNQILPRSSSDTVYAQIIRDLKDARHLLSANYPTAGRFRPNRFTASALLAKVYLYQKNWVEADKNATRVIDAGLYSLETDLNHVFLSGSNETIWALSPVIPGFETWEGYFFVPVNSHPIPSYVITKTLLNTFENGDERRQKWLHKVTVAGKDYYYPYKYKLGYDGLSTPLESYVVSRLSEPYLIRAEARAQEGNLSGAITDLNLIRKRAGLQNTTSTEQASMLRAIQHERQVELFCEWGNRWFDLKRTGKATAVLSVLKPGWQAHDSLYPIPQTELNNNPFLTQNPGY
ncbi:MAG: RagB/SusD family nutrient uptake outer membrane protein [Bacteroidota bacterium]|nr:RagB/SusD family nutrient uptake outer membrane protein [Bacteroidota bacterium]